MKEKKREGNRNKREGKGKKELHCMYPRYIYDCLWRLTYHKKFDS
jgi:hypothetical protein